jgi:hypothetical protein
VKCRYNSDTGVRWTGNGALEKKECRVFYSCIANKHQLGTGFIIDKKVRHVVIGFTPVNERISCLCVRGKFSNCGIINIHAPTEEKKLSTKDLRRPMTNVQGGTSRLS